MKGQHITIKNYLIKQYKFKLKYLYFLEIQSNTYIMSLKQHNDIVQKLLKQLQSKQKQIESLKKQLNKTSSSSQMQTTQKTKLSQVQRQHGRKMTQLHKQYKDKIATMSQQIKSKSIQNKDLKQRLTTLKNMEQKEKQQISQILKKSANMAAYDPKFAAVVSHYESELQRKDKYISNLQKQIKQNFYEKTNKNRSETVIKPNNEQAQQQNNQPVHQNQYKNSESQQYHKKYQEQINKLRLQKNKYQRLLEQKNKQFKDLTKRYSDLTKDYYKIMNQYQCGDKETNKFDSKFQTASEATKIKNDVNFIKNNNNNTSGTGIAGILEQMVQKFTQQPSQSDHLHSQTSLSYSFLSNLPNKPSDSTSTNHPINQTEIKILEDLIQNILQLLQVQNRIHIIPALTKLKTKVHEVEVYENIARYVHEMLYRMGMGKIGISQMRFQLEKFQRKINKFQESSDLLDEICIEVGAKRQKVLEKIKDYKATQEQFFTNMKDVNFMQQLPRANKYFQLDRQTCSLPQQLKKMYEQLKYVDRFLKQSAHILEKEPQGLQRTLQSILRYLERKQAQQGLKDAQKPIEKKNK